MIVVVETQQVVIAKLVDNDCHHQQVSREQAYIQARANCKEEKRGEKFIDRTNPRLQIPLRRVVRKHQPGEKSAYDRGHPNLCRCPGKQQTQGQGEDQGRILCGHAIKPRFHAVNNARAEEDHEHREAHRL